VAKKYVYFKCLVCGKRFDKREVPTFFRMEELPAICPECESKYGLQFPIGELREEEVAELSLDKPADTIVIECPKCGHKIKIWCLFSKGGVKHEEA